MIISITITSDTKETIIIDALKSVIDWVDLCVIVHLVSDCIPDNTLTIIKEVCKDKIRIYDLSSSTPWAEIRNFGIQKANELNGDWCIILDTDERIILDNIDLVKTLQELPKEINNISVSDTSLSYDKAKIFRLPCKGSFIGNVHERFSENCDLVMPYMKFYELPKTEKLVLGNLENYITELKKQSELEPQNARWPYYVGVCNETLNKKLDAFEAYSDALEIANDNLMRSWIYYKLAGLYSSTNQIQEAINVCKMGLVYYELPELRWFKGLCYLKLEKYDKAILEANKAIEKSWTKEPNDMITRTGFKEPVALYEGPYQILEQAYTKLLDTNRTEWAKRKAKNAYEMRKTI